MPLAAGPEIHLSCAFPCHPRIALPPSRSRWLYCPVCATCIRSESEAVDVYTDEYPQARGHHDAAVGRCKVRTLERWLEELRIKIAGRIVCEIGFGGAACLAALQGAGATVFGLEPVAANRAHAERLGIPRTHVFDVDPLPGLPRKPDLWLLLDSFEHVPDPNRLVAWMANQSKPNAQVLLVAPDAKSISRKLMGRFWLFESADHLVHYSRKGVAIIFARAGFRLVRSFRPVKLISLGMAWNNLRLLARMPSDGGSIRVNGPRIWVNIGQMGLLLEYNDSQR